MAIYQPGDIVAGRYRVVAPLSKGGMGAVFMAEQVSLGREVAIKVILARHGTDSRLRQRFDTEARAVCRLRHPNIITYHDYGRDQAGRPFLVMEYLPGYPGTELLRGARVPDLQQAVHILGQLCSALQAAHDSGIIHRDLKWSNLMVVPQSHDPLFTKLIDFGILKVATDGSTGDQRRHLTDTGVLLGTPQYMSPEAICGRPIDGRADQYSLAVMAYELLAGRRPFDAPQHLDLLRLHVQEPPPPMGDLGPGIARIESAILRGLAKQPSDRFPEITDFHAALASAVGLPGPTTGRRRTRPAGPRRTTDRSAPATRSRTQPSSRAAGSTATLLRPATAVGGHRGSHASAASSTPWASPERAPRRPTATPTPVPMDTSVPSATTPGPKARGVPWGVWGLVLAAALVVGFAGTLALSNVLSDPDPEAPRVAAARHAPPGEAGGDEPTAPPSADASEADAAPTSAVAAMNEGSPELPGGAASEAPDEQQAPARDADERQAPAREADERQAPASEADERQAPADPAAAKKPPRRKPAARRPPRASRAGALSIVATPYANVVIDGRPAGTTPVRVRSVRAGRVKVVLTHPTYGSKTRRVKVKAGATTKLMVDMR